MKLKFKAKCIGHNASIYGLCALNKNEFVTGDGNGSIVKWNINQAETGFQIAKCDQSIICLAFNEEMLLAGDLLGHFYQIDKENLVRRLIAHDKGLYKIVEHDGFVFTVGGDGWLKKWQGVNLIESIQLSHSLIRSIAFSPISNLAYIGDAAGIVYEINTDEMNLIQKWIAHPNTVASLCFIKDKLLVTGGKDAKLQLWDLDDNYKSIAMIDSHWYSVYDLVFVNNHIISCSRDGSIRIWDLNLNPVTTYDALHGHGHIRSVNKLCVMPGGAHLISCSDDKTAIVWELVN